LSSETRLPVLLKRARHIAILHHWDADGIASAATIIHQAERQGARCTNATPRIGDYSNPLDQAAALDSEKPDILLGLDLAVSTETLDAISHRVSATLAWVDHHSLPPRPTGAVRLYHPSTTGLDEGSSNAWFLSQLLGLPPSILAAIGTCGDLGRNLASSTALGPVERIASSVGVTVEALLRITDMVDANYRTNREEDVRRAPWILAERMDDPASLLEVDSWLANKEAVDKEFAKAMISDEQKRGEVVVKTISTDMHLTSLVARTTAKALRGKAKAVIVRNVSPANAPFYVRATAPGLDLAPLIEVGRSMGCSAGGKPEVVGMVVPRNQLEAVTETVLTALEALL